MRINFKKSYTERLSTIVSILIMVMLLGVGCKKEDEMPPSISFIKPELNQSYQAGDLVYVGVVVSDDKNIEHVKASITDGNSQSYAQNSEIIDSYQSFEEIVVNITLQTEINLSVADEYFVRVEVSDGENTNVRYRKINIDGASKETNGYLIVKGDTSNYQVELKDADFNTKKTFSHSGTFLDAFINNRDQHLVVSGGSSGDLVSYDIENENTIWTLNNINNPPQGYFKALYYNHQEHILYTSLHTSEIQSYTTSGTPKGGFMLENNNKRVDQMMATEDYLFYQVKSVSSPDIELVSAFKGSWSTHYTQTVPFDVKLIAKSENQLLSVFANDNYQAKYYLVDLTTGNYETITSLPNGELKKVIKAGSSGYIMQYVDEVYFYDVQNNWINSIHSGALITDVAYDDVNEVIVIGDQYGNINVKTTDGNSNTMYNVGSSVLNIQVWYSR